MKFLVGLALYTVILGTQIQPQTTRHHKDVFSDAQTALANQDMAAYQGHLEAMYSVLPKKGASPTDDYNRPFLLYHLARSRAQSGDLEGALLILQEILDDNIESLIVSQASFDIAFDEIRGERAFKRFMKRLDRHPIEVELLAQDLYLMTGAGASVLAKTGVEGTLLVDTGYMPGAEGIKKTLKKMGARGVTTIINTHLHEDHVGGNATFGPGVNIVSHSLTRGEMIKPQPFIGQDLPPKPPSFLPTVTSPYPLSIQGGGEEIRIIPLPGHTSGDVIVYFTQSRVLHLGDRYFPIPGQVTWMFPGPDFWAHIHMLDVLLSDIPDDGVVITGHGQPVPLLHLKQSHIKMMEAIDFVAEAIDDGLTLKELGEEGIPPEWSDLTRGREAQWLALFYNELSEKK